MVSNSERGLAVAVAVAQAKLQEAQDDALHVRCKSPYTFEARKCGSQGIRKLKKPLLERLKP